MSGSYASSIVRYGICRPCGTVYIWQTRDVHERTHLRACCTNCGAKGGLGRISGKTFVKNKKPGDLAGPSF